MSYAKRHSFWLKSLLWTIIIFTKLNNFCFSQIDTTTNLFNLKIDSLVKLPVKSSIQRKFTVKYFTNFKPYTLESITKHQLSSYAATDLMQILRTQAQFEFGIDVINQLGIFVNGIWANEGKILLLIDGHPMNENLYGTLQFGLHYPSENIQRINILRGASQLSSGDFAELAIIDVQMQRSDTPQAGLEVNFNSAPMPFVRKAYFTFAKKFYGHTLNVFARYVEGARSDRFYTDMFGNGFWLYNNKVKDLFLNLSIHKNNLKFSLLADGYRTFSQDYFVQILSRPYPKDFTLISSYIQYKKQVWPKTKVLGKTLIKFERPWESYLPRQDSSDLSYYRHVHNIYSWQNRLTFMTQLSRYLSINYGVRLHSVLAQNLSSDSAVYWTGRSTASYITSALTTELFYSKKDLSLYAGLRSQYNTIYGLAFLPQFAFCFDLKNLNIKQIYSRSIRVPTIANINYNLPYWLRGFYPKIEPEIFNVYTTELKTSLLHNIKFVLIGSYQYTKNAITYWVDKFGNEIYLNIGQLGTMSITYKISYHIPNFILRFTNSFYKSIIFDTLNIYSVAQDPQVYLGAPRFKNTYLLSYGKQHWSLNFLVIHLGPKIGFVSYDSSRHELKLLEVKHSWLVNFNFRLKIGKWQMRLYAYNLLNSRDLLFQGYNGWHAPIPYIGRTFGLKLKYLF